MCCRELLNYIGTLVDKRLAEPKNDLISELVVNQVSKGIIEKSDAVQIAFLLLVAGNATLVNMINLVSEIQVSNRKPRYPWLTSSHRAL